MRPTLRRIRLVQALVAFGSSGLLACGVSRAPVPNGNAAQDFDGGTSGAGGLGGRPEDGGASPDGGTSDGGVMDGESCTAGQADPDGARASECDGLMPPEPSAPSQFRLQNQDLVGGVCGVDDTDGTGRIAVLWGCSRYSLTTFVDPWSATVIGAYTGVGMEVTGQREGFIGIECYPGSCGQDYVVLDAAGHQLYKSPMRAALSTQIRANDPTGGMVIGRFSVTPTGTTPLLDAIDAAGGIRWTRPLDDVVPGELPNVLVGVDWRGNVLALWTSHRYGAGAWAGQWFDHAGTAGPVFQALRGGFAKALHERVGSGLFVSGYGPWLGQFEAHATSMSPPPCWLASRPNTTLHLIHGGRGYAVLPVPGMSAGCAQGIEVVSPSGQSCGTSTFAVGGGACTTNRIIVGYDGTVVQQLPREREAPCTAFGRLCDCTYRYWSGYFR